MRDLIRIVESATSNRGVTDPTLLAKILDLLTAWITHTPVPDAKMDMVMRAWPRPATGMSLWRVQVLQPAEARRLRQGLVLPVHRYLSWTKARDTVDRLAMARHGKGRTAIVHMPVPASRICIDVQAFLDHLVDLESHPPTTRPGEHARYDFEIGDLAQYADEAEVIVAHDAPLRLDTTNTKVFQPPKAAPPQIGDRVYQVHSLSEDPYEITAVLGRNRDGSWRVAWHYDESDVRPVAPGEWEIIDRY